MKTYLRCRLRLLFKLKDCICWVFGELSLKKLRILLKNVHILEENA